MQVLLHYLFSSILQAGAALPILKEVLIFSDVDPQTIVKAVSQYIPGLDLAATTEASEPTDQDAS